MANYNITWYLCHELVPYLSHTCPTLVQYLSHTCAIPVLYLFCYCSHLSGTCPILVPYLSCTCPIHAPYLFHTFSVVVPSCPLPVLYFSHTYTCPTLVPNMSRIGWLPITPFQMPNFHQSLCSEVGLIIIKVPNAPLHLKPSKCFAAENTKWAAV